MKPKNSEFWTADKVKDLITLYQHNECLWNVTIEDYKNRQKRDAAIVDICEHLDLTKEQFTKKVHNLRNQFNFELKKSQQKSLDNNTQSKSKWEYFENLYFLKRVITPRPGPNYFHTEIEVQYESADEKQNIKDLLDESEEYKQNYEIYQEEDLTDQPFSHENSRDYDIQQSKSFTEKKSIPTTSNSNQAGDPLEKMSKKLMKKFKVSPKIEISTPIKRTASQYQNRQETEGKESNKKVVENKITEHKNPTKESPIIPEKRICKDTPIILENYQVNPSENFHFNKSIVEPVELMKIDQPRQMPSPQNNSKNNNSNGRDEFDLFGEFIANEFRNLVHETSKKKLKRRIMKALLDTANEDDDTTTSNDNLFLKC